MKVNDTVSWKWGNGTAEGTITKISHQRTEISSKGETIVRNGSSDDPALIIKNKSGDKILKLQSEVTKS